LLATLALDLSDKLTYDDSTQFELELEIHGGERVLIPVSHFKYASSEDDFLSSARRRLSQRPSQDLIDLIVRVAGEAKLDFRDRLVKRVRTVQSEIRFFGHPSEKQFIVAYLDWALDAENPDPSARRFKAQSVVG